MPFTVDDLIRLYDKKRDEYGKEAHRHTSAIMKEAKEQHRREFFRSGKKKDHEQSWRAFKGKSLEKLLIYILEKEVKALGLQIISGGKLDSQNLPPFLDKVRQNLLVDFGEFGKHLPDVDLVVFDPEDGAILAVLSVKVTLRERIAQTGYWKRKFSDIPAMRDIKVYFVTLDEDETLVQRHPAKKGRAIVETDTDGSYVLSAATIEESGRVKMFDQLIEDLKEIRDLHVEEDSSSTTSIDKPSCIEDFHAE